MSWLQEAFMEPSAIQTIVVISMVAAIGLRLGKLKLFGVSLGITFVFFTGIIVGHFGIVLDRDMLTLSQNFGLILFVYTLGLQVGPGFFSSFKKEGIQLNLMATGVIFTGLLLTLVLHWTTHVSLPNMVGLLSGAVTNTPVLGAAQQALLQLRPGSTKEVSDMALACAVAYPLGVMGVIFAIILLRKLSSSGLTPPENQETRPNVSEFQVGNPGIYHKTIQEIMKLTGKQFVISRIWRDGKVSIPASDSVLEEGDHLLIISAKKDINEIKALFGIQENVDWNKEDIDWNAIDSNLISRRVVVTQSKINGVRLGSLRLRNLYGINITRINRAGIELVASPKLRLQIGDRLTIVGEATAVKNVIKILGDEAKLLTSPNQVAIFLGILFGVLLGTLPIAFPGMTTPIRLGIAGGPIIVGILVGAFGPQLHITTYTTQSANLMLRQLGIVIYLAGLGVDAGAHFFETVFRGEGLLWIGLGFLLTMVPVLLVGFIAKYLFKLDYAHNVGMLCGSMANPMALNFANTTVEGDEPSVSYATVYPLSMFLRVITAQLIIMLFL
ncbi:MAG: putative transporter [Tannerellaceae bacterium]|nr:putative transporter [Tannerellaceae bacterium]